MPNTNFSGPLKRASSLARGVVVAATLLVAACGGGNDGPAGPGGMIPGGGSLTWLDDGARHSAGFATAALSRSTMMDYLLIAGGESSGVGISFGAAVTPPISAGAVACGSGQYPFASFSYNPGVGVYTSCSVTISTITLTGTPHVTGTFEAVFPKTGGGSKTLSEGKFDLAMTVTSL